VWLPKRRGSQSTEATCACNTKQSKPGGFLKRAGEDAKTLVSKMAESPTGTTWLGRRIPYHPSYSSTWSKNAKSLKGQATWGSNSGCTCSCKRGENNFERSVEGLRGRNAKFKKKNWVHTTKHLVSLTEKNENSERQGGNGKGRKKKRKGNREDEPREKVKKTTISTRQMPTRAHQIGLINVKRTRGR